MRHSCVQLQSRKGLQSTSYSFQQICLAMERLGWHSLQAMVAVKSERSQLPIWTPRWRIISPVNRIPKGAHVESIPDILGANIQTHANGIA